MIAKKKGSAKIIAKVDGKKYTCKVTVKAKAGTEEATTQASMTQAPTTLETVTPMQTTSSDQLSVTPTTTSKDQSNIDDNRKNNDQVLSVSDK